MHLSCQEGLKRQTIALSFATLRSGFRQPWRMSMSVAPVEHLPGEMVMPATAMVDAARAGLDRGEFATVPSLPDLADWNAYEAARQALMPNLSRAEPAARFGVRREPA